VSAVLVVHMMCIAQLNRCDRHRFMAGMGMQLVYVRSPLDMAAGTL
jgi:hypothetical protein